MVTTMTTVGYGDMSVTTDVERFFCMCLMAISVVLFGLISGKISS